MAPKLETNFSCVQALLRRHLDDIKKYFPEFIPDFVPEFDLNTDFYSGKKFGMNSGTNFGVLGYIQIKCKISDLPSFLTKQI